MEVVWERWWTNSFRSPFSLGFHAALGMQPWDFFWKVPWFEFHVKCCIPSPVCDKLPLHSTALNVFGFFSLKNKDLTPLITHMRKDCHCVSAQVAAAIGHFQPALFVHGPALLQTMPRFLPEDQQLFTEHVRAHAFSVASPTLAPRSSILLCLWKFSAMCSLRSWTRCCFDTVRLVPRALAFQQGHGS